MFAGRVKIVSHARISVENGKKKVFNIFYNLPVLKSRYLSYKTNGHVYSSCVQSAMFHASETWPLTKTNLIGP